MTSGSNGSPGAHTSDLIVTTANDLEGFRVMRHLGVVRGFARRSLGWRAADAALQQERAEQSWSEAQTAMTQQAAKLGADAVIAMRCVVTPLAEGVAELLVYGTAVSLEPR